MTLQISSIHKVNLTAGAILQHRERSTCNCEYALN